MLVALEKYFAFEAVVLDLPFCRVNPASRWQIDPFSVTPDGVYGGRLEGLPLLLIELLAMPHYGAIGPSLKLSSHADHDNLKEDGAFPSLETQSVARVAMLSQSALGSTTPFNIAPRYLMVPSSLKTTAQHLAATLNPTSISSANPFAGNIVPVVEPRLRGTACYVAADPAMYPALKLAVHTGTSAPSLPTTVRCPITRTRRREHVRDWRESPLPRRWRGAWLPLQAASLGPAGQRRKAVRLAAPSRIGRPSRHGW